jgi:hypothetical protein
MKSSQLIRVLQTFSKKEFRELQKWVLSPAHNQREDVVRLLDWILQSGILESEAPEGDRRVAFEAAYPDAPYDDDRLRQSMHFLMKVVEAYLLFAEYTEKDTQVRITLARVFRKRQLHKTFLRTFNQAHKEQEKQPYRNELYYRTNYLLQQEQYLALSEQKRLAELNLQEMTDALDIAYLVDKLRQSCIMLSHKQVYNVDYDFELTDFAISYIEGRPELLALPAISIYYHTYKTIGQEDGQEKNFKALKRTMFEHGHLFTNAEIRDIYLLAINYCIQQLNAGRRDYIKESFDLYRKGLEERILIENNILSRWTFRNVVAAGLYLKKYDWVYAFIQDYQRFLEKRHRESMVDFNLAKLYFEKGDYAKARPLLMQFDFDDILMTLNAKTMLLKMYYEEEEFDVLESLLESMRNYVQRKKVIGYHKSNYRNIIRYTRRLLRVNPYDREAKQKLGHEISEAQPLTEREWLLRQLDYEPQQEE